MDDLRSRSNGIEHHAEPHLDAGVPKLVDCIVGGDDEHALGLQVPHDAYQLRRFRGLSDQNGDARDGVVHQRHSELAQQLVRYEAAVAGALVRVRVVGLAKRFYDLRGDHRRLARGERVLHRGLAAQAGRVVVQQGPDVPEPMDLPAVPRIHGGKLVSGLRIFDRMVLAVLGDRVVQRALGQLQGSLRSPDSHLEDLLSARPTGDQWYASMKFTASRRPSGGQRIRSNGTDIDISNVPTDGRRRRCRRSENDRLERPDLGMCLERRQRDLHPGPQLVHGD